VFGGCAARGAEKKSGQIFGSEREMLVTARVKAILGFDLPAAARGVFVERRGRFDKPLGTRRSTSHGL
jgi:hypothetical protein